LKQKFHRCAGFYSENIRAGVIKLEVFNKINNLLDYNDYL